MTRIEQTTLEFTTAKGRTIRIGDHYRDTQRGIPRDLIVTDIGVYQPPAYGGDERPPICSVTCSVTRTRGEVVEIMKPTTINATALTGRAYELVTEGGQR